MGLAGTEAVVQIGGWGAPGAKMCPACGCGWDRKAWGHGAVGELLIRQWSTVVFVANFWLTGLEVDHRR